MLKAVRAGSEKIHIHAFTALEVHEGARRLGVGDAGNAIAGAQSFLGDDSVGDETGERIVGAADFGKLRREIVGEERADVGDLAAGFREEDGAVEHDFRFRAGGNFVDFAFGG